MPAEGWDKWEHELGISAEQRQEKLEADLESSRLQAEAAVPGLKEQTFKPEQIKEAARISLNMLAGLAMPTVFKFLFPKVLLAAWQLLVQCVERAGDFSQIALGIPRGHGKTTVLKIFILFCILFTKKKFILVVSSTAGLAENIIADVTDMLNESNIIRLFGDWKLGIEMNRQDLKKFGYRDRNIILAAIGAEGSLRGLNLKNERPDVMIFDDIQTRECADSKLQSDTLKRWLIGTAMKAKSPAGCLFIFAGNMYPTEHSILKGLKTNKTWIKFISGAILADGSALWPELRSLESLLDEFDSDLAMGHPEIFFSEVLNDTEAGVNTKVDFSLIKAWPWSVEEQPQGKFIIIDPSANKKGGDNVGIGYFEVFDAVPGMRRVIDERLSPGNTIRSALLLALQTGTKLIAVESTAFQSTLLYWAGVIMDEYHITGIEFVEVYSGSNSKNARIIDMLKGLTSGEVYIHDSLRSVVTHTISNWNPLKRDNNDTILDLLAYATKVLELYGPQCATDTDIETVEAGTAEVHEFEHAF